MQDTRYKMYNTTNGGLRQHTLAAVVAAVEQALAELAPGRLVLSQGELHDASVNRSPQAFERNPDRGHPDGIDPATTLLRLEREGRVVGVVNWFATHGTSLTNRNLLISGDNKGYRARLGGRGAVGAAFAQTNAGDVSPNVPNATQGPTDDEVENARVIGERQLVGRAGPGPVGRRGGRRAAVPQPAGGGSAMPVGMPVGSAGRAGCPLSSSGPGIPRNL